MGSGLLATFRCVCRVSCGCGVKAVGCSYGYVTRGVELVPCDATEEWQRLVVVRDCSDLSSSRRLDHFASSALPAPSSEPPGPPRGPPAPDPPRPSASVRSSVTRPSRVCHAHASLSTHPGPIRRDPRASANRCSASSLAPRRLVHATAVHAPTPRQATHTNTLSEKACDAHWSEITSRPHRVLFTPRPIHSGRRPRTPSALSLTISPNWPA
jgi:hypothetical protein